MPKNVAHEGGHESVAIVGIGGIFPDAPDLDRFWANIIAGTSSAREVPAGRWLLPADAAYDPTVGAPDRVYSRRGCFVAEALADLPMGSLRIGRDILQSLDPLFHLLLYAGRQAFSDAVTDNLDLGRVGVIIGNLALPTESSAALARSYLGRTFAERLFGAAKAPSFPTVNPLNRYVTGLPAGVLAKALGLGGGSYTLDAACASSLYAIKLAVDELLSGRADAMLTGGVSRPDPLYTQMGFSQLRALSATGTCSPFDARGDGLVVGEGAGIFVLKRTSDAVAAGDRIYGVIRGIGLANDVGGSLLAPLSEGQLRAMRAAYREAGWTPRQVDLVECHATGTPVGDAVEFASLRALWGEAEQGERECIIGSVKSNIGHLLTAAGSAALTKTLLAIREETLPPTANFVSPPAAIDLESGPFRVLTSAKPWPRRADGAPRRAGVSAFGFGGINAHLLVEEWRGAEGGGDSFVEPAIRVRMTEAGEGDLPRTAAADISIAVVGMATHFGPWDTLRSFQQRVLGGDEGAEPTEPGNWWGAPESAWFREQGLSGAQFKGFTLDGVAVAPGDFRIPPRELEEMLPQQLLMLQVAALAMADAGLDREEKLRAGVFIGLGLDLNTTNFSLRWWLSDQGRTWARELGLNLDEEELSVWIETLKDASGPPLTANRTMGALGSVVASRIAREFRIGGPSFTVSSEESSGISALEVGVRFLRSGLLDQAVVGAVDLAGDIRAILATHSGRPFSPAGQSAPFDKGADGALIGEGAAAVILKRLADAERDGDRIYGVIKGIGVAGGGGMDAPFVDGSAYRSALDRAYGEAGLPPASIGYLEAHGSGHPAEDAVEAEAVAEFFAMAEPPFPCVIGSVKNEIGHPGAAAGLAGLVKSCLCLYQELLPPLRGLSRPRGELGATGRRFLFPATPRYWLRNRAAGPRRAGVSSFSVDGNCTHVVLEAWEGPESELAARERLNPLGLGRETLLVIGGDHLDELDSALERLRRFVATAAPTDIVPLACQWRSDHPADFHRRLAMAFVPRSRDELLEQINVAKRHLAETPEKRLGGNDPTLPPAARDRIFYAPAPLGGSGKLAFVYPGSGNHFPGMGVELSCRWPEVYREQDRKNRYLAAQYQPELFWSGVAAEELNSDHRALIFGQVALGTAVSDLVRRFGVEPQAAIGYSLGESAALFSLGAWQDRDLMLKRIHASTLFTRDLAGECRAARETWKIPATREVEWSIGVVDAPAREVRRALKNTPRAYLLIVNTPQECVVGGEGKSLKRLVALLGCTYIPLQGVTTVHCEVAAPVAAAYRDLHLFRTTPPAGVTFYSGAWGTPFTVSRERAADAILAQALDGLDYPRVIEAAWNDGVRIFLEMGPGGSCSRMIGRILDGRPHLARSACFPGQDPVSTVLRLLGQLVAERIPVNLELLCGADPIAVTSGSSANRLVIPVGGEPFQILPPERRTPERASDQVAVPAAAAVAQPVSSNNGPQGEGQHSMAAGQTEFSRPSVPSSHGRGAILDDTASVPTAGSALPARDADPLLRGVAAAQEAKLRAHEAYLHFASTLNTTMAANLKMQMALAGALQSGGGTYSQDLRTTAYPEGEVADRTLSRKDRVGVAPVLYDRALCQEFATGSLARMLGPDFAEADTFPTRVRLPDEPLMLVDRIMTLEGEPRSMSHGRVVTEHDILPDAWYLDAGRIPTCIAVEAGQADLFLSGYLGIDFITRGLAVYRLLDAVVTFHRGLPGPGETIQYDIRIESFFRQDKTYLFRFSFEGTVNGEPLLSMRDGCAGFFSAAELAAGKGIVHTRFDLMPQPGKRPSDWRTPVPMGVESYDAARIDALRHGDLAGCFGELFRGLPIRSPFTIPGGRMKLVDRVTHLDPAGGRFGLGLIRAEADIDPGAWFLTCHFVDDRVMPGTLMYECCLHTLRIYLLRMGWVGEAATTACEPVPGLPGQLKCRGQVTESTRIVTYEVVLKEIGYRPEPYVVVDALMYADGKAIVEITGMSARLTGLSEEKVLALWRGKIAGAPVTLPPAPSHRGRGSNDYEQVAEDRDGAKAPSPLVGEGRGEGATKKPAIFDYDRILAFATGNPSEAFGEPYRVFDRERKIARLPGPPFQFLDRVTAITVTAWKMVAGGSVEAQYDVPADAWYFAANRQPAMPFAVLLEAALQPCGWLAAYIGSALTSATDLSFRNLGGNAVQHREVTAAIGTLTMTATITRVASSGGMVIQNYDFSVSDAFGVVYDGDTVFGFFSKEALAQQVGIREAVPYEPDLLEIARGREFSYPEEGPFPERGFRMVDRIELIVPDGGPKGLGFIRGTKRVDPEEWFFKAHFYEDPVCPGSLGLESFLQLLKVAAVERWGGGGESRFQSLVLGRKQSWTYRGQVVPVNTEVTVEAVITAVDDVARIIQADGLLSVDGRVIYQMNDFTLQMEF